VCSNVTPVCLTNINTLSLHSLFGEVSDTSSVFTGGHSVAQVDTVAENEETVQKGVLHGQWG